MFRNEMANIKSDTHRLTEDKNVPKEETKLFYKKRKLNDYSYL